MANRKNITTIGERHNLLEAIRQEPNGSDGRSRWRYRCDCGGEIVTRPSSVRYGVTKSCGCLPTSPLGKRSYDQAKNVGSANGKFRHGLLGSREHNTWVQMRNRCINPDSPHFPNYGGRGIAVCERWESFETFLADMGPRPPGMSLDRIDPNGGYSRENCRWATPKEQMRNRRNTIFVEYQGRTMPLAEACEATGTKWRTARARVAKGISFDCG